MREARLIGVTHLYCHRCKRSGGLRRAAAFRASARL